MLNRAYFCLLEVSSACSCGTFVQLCSAMLRADAGPRNASMVVATGNGRHSFYEFVLLGGQFNQQGSARSRHALLEVGSCRCRNAAKAAETAHCCIYATNHHSTPGNLARGKHQLLANEVPSSSQSSARAVSPGTLRAATQQC